MRKTWNLLLAVLLLVSVSACGKAQPTWQEQYDLGVRYLEEGSYEEAVIAFTAAIEIDPKRAEAYEKLADAYVALDDIESALEILRQGAEAIGDDALFQSRIDELTAETEQSPGSPSGSSPDAASEPQVERFDESDNNGGYWLYYYDEAGKNTRMERYDQDGTLTRYILNYYRETENRIRCEFYDSDGTLDAIHYFDEYSETGKLLREEQYYPDGTLKLIAYHEADQLVREEFYNPDGTLDRITTENGTQWYNPDGTLIN